METALPLSTSPRRISTNAVWIALLVLIAAPVFALAVYKEAHNESIATSDFLGHARAAEQMLDIGVTPPYFLYQLVLISVRTIFPAMDYMTAGWVVATALHVVLAVIFYVTIRPLLGNSNRHLYSLATVVIALSLMVIAPITVPSWAQRNLYHGYIPIHPYHNPTVVLLKPLALLALLQSVRVFDSERPVRRVDILWSAVLMLLVTLAKPSYSIALLPALMLYAGYRFFRNQTVHWRLLIVGFVLPLVFILGAQYVFYFDGLRNQTGVVEEANGIIFLPFSYVTKYNSVWLVPIRFLLSILFPLCVTCVYRQQAAKSNLLKIAWLAFVASALYAYFLSESGTRMRSGNFMWGAQVGLLLLFFASVVFLIQQNPLQRLANGLIAMSPGFIVCITVFSLHLISGVLWTSVHVFAMFNYIEYRNWW